MACGATTHIVQLPSMLCGTGFCEDCLDGAKRMFAAPRARTIKAMLSTWDPRESDSLQVEKYLAEVGATKVPPKLETKERVRRKKGARKSSSKKSKKQQLLEEYQAKMQFEAAADDF